MDITKYPQGPQEIVKYMEYMPEDESARMQLLMRFLSQLVSR